MYKLNDRRPQEAAEARGPSLSRKKEETELNIVRRTERAAGLKMRRVSREQRVQRARGHRQSSQTPMTSTSQTAHDELTSQSAGSFFLILDDDMALCCRGAQCCAAKKTEFRGLASSTFPPRVLHTQRSAANERVGFEPATCQPWTKHETGRNTKPQSARLVAAPLGCRVFRGICVRAGRQASP